METVKRHIESALTRASWLRGRVVPNGSHVDDGLVACYTDAMIRELDAALSALPGPRKLVWEQSSYARWKAGPYDIVVDSAGQFRPNDEPMTFDRLAAAQDRCQEVADASADPLANLRGRLQNDLASLDSWGHLDKHQQGRRDAFKDILTLIDAPGGTV